MKKLIKLSYIVFFLIAGFVLFAGKIYAQQGDISENAKRHFDRATAAVEMAENNNDYAEAEYEFQQAVNLAPAWTEAYYNLALVQEKLGKYNEALSNLKFILEKSTSSDDTADIKSLINKISYKREKVSRKAHAVEPVTSVKKAQKAREYDIPKIGAFVTELKFFESGKKKASSGSRKYSNYFKKNNTRRIWGELDLEYPSPGAKSYFDLEVVYTKPNGNVLGHFVYTASVKADWTGSLHTFQWGWNKYGRWPKGKYQVEVYHDKKLIAAEEFSIY